MPEAAVDDATLTGLETKESIVGGLLTLTGFDDTTEPPGIEPMFTETCDEFTVEPAGSVPIAILTGFELTKEPEGKLKDTHTGDETIAELK